jgi:hypothetical protein
VDIYRAASSEREDKKGENFKPKGRKRKYKGSYMGKINVKRVKIMVTAHEH